MSKGKGRIRTKSKGSKGGKSTRKKDQGLLSSVKRMVKKMT